jgi:3-keto-5-aminohexanoate cleavage enzyme
LSKLIITCAITGSRIQKKDTPFIPITPEEIAKSAIEAVKAGASVIHIHVRDPQTHIGTQDKNLYERVLALMKEEVDPVICLSTSGVPGKNMGYEKRIIPLELSPDMVSFDAGSMNFGDTLFLNPPDFLELLAKKARACNVKLELECFHTGMVNTCLDMMKAGFIERPLHFQFVLGVKGGAPATLKSLLSMVDMIPEDSTWSIIGIGRSQLPMAMASMVINGHVRVGLEDNIYYSKGMLAKTNAQLVERIVRIAREYEREIATPEEAREILSLKPKVK